MLIEKISKQLAEHISMSLNVENEKTVIYEYGLQIFLSTTLDIFLAFLLGILTHNTIEIFIFLLVYCSIRMYAGGFHAKSSKQCMGIFLLGIMIMLVLPKYNYRFEYVLILIVIENLLVIYLAPVTAINNPLDDLQRRKMKRRAIRINLLWSLLLIFAQLVNLEFSSFGLFAFIWISLVLIAGSLKKTFYGGKTNVKRIL